MRPFKFALPVVLFFGLAGVSPAWPEDDQKNLKDLLVDKGVISEQEARSVRETVFSKWVDRVTVSGDLRLRHESFFKEPEKDRHRERFRFRIGGDFKTGNFTIGVRLASGNGEQTSTNQSFDNLFSQKALWIDRAYVAWQGTRFSWLKLTGGRMPNPFFQVSSTDIVWDTDVNPEGFAQSLQILPGESVGLFINAGQFVLDEDSGDNQDQWLFGQQVGAMIRPVQDAEINLAAAYYDFVNTTQSSFGQVVCLPGNTRAVPCSSSLPNAGQLANDFNVLNLTGQVNWNAGRYPVSVQCDYVKNLAGTKNLATGEETGDTGYQAGIVVGKAKRPHTWELAYFYKVLQSDAMVADLPDADFGDGGTDRRGHIIWGAYNLTESINFKVRFLSTKKAAGTQPPPRDDIDRLQVDAVWSF